MGKRRLDSADVQTQQRTRVCTSTPSRCAPSPSPSSASTLSTSTTKTLASCMRSASLGARPRRSVAFAPGPLETQDGHRAESDVRVAKPSAVPQRLHAPLPTEGLTRANLLALADGSDWALANSQSLERLKRRVR